jgi:protoheme ferro-lyase
VRVLPHGNNKNVVALLLCLPGSNASIERVLSRINYIWSEEKSRFHVDTIQAILAVTTYVNLLCEALREKLASNPEVLKTMRSSDKCMP